MKRTLDEVFINDRAENEEGLKLKTVIVINPPPEDEKCECCGRHISELRPFGKSEDPLVDSLKGSLLVRRSRPHAPPDEEAKRIHEEFYGNCKTRADIEKAREKMIKKLGEKQADWIELILQAADTFGASWECRDCIVLDQYEYFEKKQARYIEEPNNGPKT